MASGKKQYGLILPSKGPSAKPPTASTKNVFGDDSDSDTNDGADWVKKSLKLEAQKSVLKRATKVQMQKALEEDPTVFQYDELYDDLKPKKVVTAEAEKAVEKKKPRYIQAIKQAAERRKKENERRIERQVQKEREEEGNQFIDKESFVTASYRQKLEEFKKQEEEEKRMERLEAIGDVTKQKDLTGFYRHLYRQTMGESLPGSDNATETDKGGKNSTDGGMVTPDDSEQVTPELEDSKSSSKPIDRKKDRHYRKRRSSSSCSENSDQSGETKGGAKRKSIDADSDISSSSSSSSDSETSVTGSGSEEGEITKKKKEPKISLTEEEVPKKKQKTESSIIIKEEMSDETFPLAKDNSEKEELKPAVGSEVIKSEPKDSESPKSGGGDSENLMDSTQDEKKVKINIWAKRTVGQALDDAVQRYYERKAIRASLRRA